MFFGFRSGSVLFVTHMFHPFNNLAVELFLNGNMRHPGRWRGAMPVLFPGSKPDHITRMNFLHRPAPALRPTAARGDDQRLAERMRMPRRPSARFEGDAGAGHTR